MCPRLLLVALVLQVLIRADILEVPASFPDIRSAIATSASGDTIRVAAGSYTGAENCDLVLEKDGVSLIAPAGPDSTVIDCKGLSRCLRITAIGVSVSGFHFKNGMAPETVSNVRHRGSSSKSLPRRRRRKSLLALIGIFADSEGNISFEPMIERTDTRKQRPRLTKKGQNRKEKYGGPKRAVSSLRARVAPQSFGGCIFVSEARNLQLSKIQISSGKALYGGGLGISGGNTVEIFDTEIFQNGIKNEIEKSSEGGGAYVSGVVGLTFSNCSFRQNFMHTEVLVDGGGLSVYNSTKINFIGKNEFVENSISCSNIAAYGGGFYFETVSDVFFSGIFIVSGNSMIAAGQGRPELSGGGGYIWLGKNIKFFGKIIFANNSAACDGCGVYGTGLILQDTFVAMSGEILFFKNRMASTGSASNFGAGLAVYSCEAEFTNLFFSQNEISSDGWADVLIGAAMFSSASVVTIAGATFEKNTIFSTLSQTIANITYSTPESSSPIHCAASTSIQSTNGVLSDGSAGKFTRGRTCMWTIETSDPFTRVFGKFEIKFRRLDFGTDDSVCYYSYISLHDGASPRAPLIGKYCGTLEAPVCASGRCPPISDVIFTTKAQLTIIFYTRIDSDLGDGFELEWETIRTADDATGAAGYVPAALADIPSFGSGAGLFIEKGTTILDNCTFIQNSIFHSLVSLGSALSVTLSATAEIRRSFFIGNSVAGNIAGGGAISIISNSLAKLDAVIFQQNSAFGFGRCLLLTGNENTCPASFGSTILANGGSVEIAASEFTNNLARCENSFSTGCRSHGGALAVTQFGGAKISKSFFSLNKVHCDTSTGCIRGSGGAVFGDSGVISVSNSNINGNFVDGVGTGGGLAVSDAGIISVENSRVFGNVATMGGALSCLDESSMILTGTNFTDNRATSIAGTVIASGPVFVNVTACLFVNNSAVRISNAFGYNDDNRAIFILNRNVFIAEEGIVALLLGRLMFDSTSLNCTTFGTVYDFDYSPNFFSSEFSICKSGSYAAGRAFAVRPFRICRTCPYGARCLGGGANSDGLLSLSGFWGSVNETTGVATFYSCPSGYCCDSSEGCVFDFCRGGREGRLCGACAEGSGRRYFSIGCGPNDSCNDAWWVALLIIAGAFCFAIFLVRTTGNKASGILSVQIYFYQVLPLIKSTPWKTNVSAFLSTLESVFSLSPSSNSDQNLGVCLFPGMRESQRLAGNLLFNLVVALSFIFLFGFNFAAALRFPSLFSIPCKRRYLISFLRFLSIAYTSLVLTPLSMLQCLEIEGKFVWWKDATVQCYERWQITGLVAIIILIPLPALTMVQMHRWSSLDALSEHQRLLYRVLSNPFVQSRRWWLGVSLYRRFIVVLIFTTTTDLNWRGMAMIVTCVVFLSMNLILHPFREPVSHGAESISLIILCLLAGISLPQLSHTQYGALNAMWNEETIEMIQLILVSVPITFYVALYIFRFCSKIHSNKEKLLNLFANLRVPRGRPHLGWIDTVSSAPFPPTSTRGTREEREMGLEADFNWLESDAKKPTEEGTFCCPTCKKPFPRYGEDEWGPAFCDDCELC